MQDDGWCLLYRHIDVVFLYSLCRIDHQQEGVVSDLVVCHGTDVEAHRTGAAELGQPGPV